MNDMTARLITKIGDYSLNIRYFTFKGYWGLVTVRPKRGGNCWQKPNLF